MADTILPKQEIHTQVDFYAVLGVSRDAKPEEIKEAYTELILLHHPDKGGDIKKFKDVQLAYKILSDETKRKTYTDALSATFQEITSTYRDSKTGKHIGIGYQKSEEDFVGGGVAKKDAFMNKFDNNRSQEEKDLLDKMKKELEEKEKRYKEMDYASLRDLYDSDLPAPPVINCLQEGGFDVNMFNQLFEKSKKSQTTDLETYCDPMGHMRTDLAQIEGNLFTEAFDTLPQGMSHDFMTYQTPQHLGRGDYDPTINVTLTQPCGMDPNVRTLGTGLVDPKKLLFDRLKERETFDKEIKTNIGPPIVDTNKMSYNNLLPDEVFQ
jgi:curved DNA-binding protein CbpA